MKISRGISRLILHTINTFITPLELLNPRLFMRFYVKFLTMYGVKFFGLPRYISSKARFDDFDLVSIGDRVVISRNVILLTHDYSVTTALIANGEVPVTDICIRRPIYIGNNVFVGMNSIIMPGSAIGDNVIIGAGSVVRGEVEECSILVGNPARKVGNILENPDRWRVRSTGPGSSYDAD